MNKFKCILAFCILMGNEKVLDKSPDYILEKFDRYVESGAPDAYNWGLDGKNTQTFNAYLAQWFPKKDADEHQTSDVG